MLKVKPQGFIGWLSDMLMTPLMYLTQGTLREVPQRTHHWNNYKLKPCEITHLDNTKALSFDGDRSTMQKRWLGIVPIFHIPIFGGWKKFVVLTPVVPCLRWNVGWIPSDDWIGVSMVSSIGPVRVLIGPDHVKFFGIDEQGQQVEIMSLGEGRVGKAGIFASVPLF